MGIEQLRLALELRRLRNCPRRPRLRKTIQLAARPARQLRVRQPIPSLRHATDLVIPEREYLCQWPGSSEDGARGLDRLVLLLHGAETPAEAGTAPATRALVLPQRRHQLAAALAGLPVARVVRGAAGALPRNRRVVAAVPGLLERLPAAREPAAAAAAAGLRERDRLGRDDGRVGEYPSVPAPMTGVHSCQARPAGRDRTPHSIKATSGRRSGVNNRSIWKSIVAALIF